MAVLLNPGLGTLEWLAGFIVSSLHRTALQQQVGLSDPGLKHLAQISVPGGLAASLVMGSL